MLQRSGRIASRSPEKQEQPRTQIQGGSPYLGPRSQLAATGFAWQALQCKNATLKRVRALEYAGACPRWAQIWAQTQPREDFGGATCCKQWCAGTGLNRRHQDFQFSPAIGSIPWLFNALLAGGLTPNVTLGCGRLHAVYVIPRLRSSSCNVAAMFSLVRLRLRRTRCTSQITRAEKVTESMMRPHGEARSDSG